MPDIFAENFNQFKRLTSSNSMELVNLFNEGKLDAIVINSDFFTQIQGSALRRKLLMNLLQFSFAKIMLSLQAKIVFR